MAGDKQYQPEILIKSAPHKEIQISTTLSDLVTECTKRPVTPLPFHPGLKKNKDKEAVPKYHQNANKAVGSTCFVETG